MTFLKRVYQTMMDCGLLRHGDTVIAGVSGGPDSTALLEALRFWQGELGLRLIVGHVHHGMRGSSGPEQRFVERLCAERGLVCETARVSVSTRGPGSLEERARDERFSALAGMAKKYKADAVALGHHQDDLAETVLMRVIRGTGLQGLQAILPAREIDGTRFVRPLIHTTRQEIEGFLKKNRIAYCVDPSNADTRFSRNRIRHELLPLLKEKYNPAIVRALSGLAETSGADHDFIEREAGRVFDSAADIKVNGAVTFSLGEIVPLHPAVVRVLLRRAVSAVSGSTRALTFDHIRSMENFLKDSSGKTREIRLPRGIRVIKTRGRITIQARTQD